MKNIILFIICLTGCSSVNQKLDPKFFYRRDIKIKANGHKGTGTLVLPRAGQYEFEIESRGRMDLFTFASCHREISKENAGESGLFGNRKKTRLTFRPNRDIEAGELACPINLGGFEKIKGRHSWGIVEFEHPSVSLPALIKCNGSTYNSRGVTICQSRAGLIQEIGFSEPVLVGDSKCVKMEDQGDSKTFRYKTPLGECVQKFLARAPGDEKWHRLVTIGYEKILIREN